MSDKLWQEKMPETTSNPAEMEEYKRKAEALLAQLESWTPIGSTHEYQTRIKGLTRGLYSLENHKKLYGYYVQCYWASHDYLIDQRELKLQYDSAKG